MATNATPVLEVRDLTVLYDSRPAVENFVLTIAPGEIVGLTGDSGSGKSTLALALLGLTRGPGHIETGSVTLDGTDLLAIDEASRREKRGRDISLIVQNPRGALSPLHRIGQQIGAVYTSHQRGSRSEIAERAVAMLRTLGLNDPERRALAYPHEISGGMAQRVLIAMALGSGPRLLVADEPTSGLDVTIQAQFLDEMWRNVRKVGSAALLMTQDLGIIANYCDRVIVLQNGRQVEDAPTRSFYSSPRDSYSRSVLALRKEDPPADPVPAPLLTIREMTKTFPLRGTTKRVQAVDDVSFTIGRGETLGLVGESGSGKTTVGRCILRLIEPDTGDIVFGDISVAKAGPVAMRALRRKLQVVFQDPFDSLDPRWTVADILAEAMETKPDKGRIAELLQLVGLGADVARAKAACAQRRVAAARQHRACDCCRTGTDRARRTDLRADAARAHRHHSAATRPAGTPWRLVSVHFPRPEHGGAHEPSRRRHVSRPDRRAGHARAGVPQSDCIPYSKALLAAHLVADPSAPPRRSRKPRDTQRRNSKPDRPSSRLLSREPLPGCAAGMPRAAAETPSRSRRTPRALHASGRRSEPNHPLRRAS